MMIQSTCLLWTSCKSGFTHLVVLLCFLDLWSGLYCPVVQDVGRIFARNGDDRNKDGQCNEENGESSTHVERYSVFFCFICRNSGNAHLTTDQLFQHIHWLQIVVFHVQLIILPSSLSGILVRHFITDIAHWLKCRKWTGITVIAVFCRYRFSRLRFAALHQCLRESMCSARQNVKSHICVLKRVQQTCSQTKFSVQCTVYIFTQWVIVFNVSVWLVLSLSCTLSMTTLWVHCPQSSILSRLVKE